MSEDNPTTNALACVEEQIVRVSGEIQQRVALLCNLQAQRNSLLPISRLPPETLAIIFIYGAREHYDSGRSSCPSRLPGWVNVSYVCSHWRSTALNCQKLWAYHFNLSLRWTEELLLRSKHASMKVSCIYQLPSSNQGPWWSPREKRWLSPADKFLEHSERVQELRLFIPPDFLPSKLSLRAPRLEILEIHLHRKSESSLEIIDGDTPVLRTLKLVRCPPLPWYSVDLKRLNVLHIYDTPIQLNMAELLALLSGMQNLSILQLRRALPSARGILSSGGLGTSPKINLPCLSFMSLIAPSSAVVALLSLINFPLRTRFDLELLLESDSSVRDYAPVSSFLAQQFSPSQQPSLPGLTLCSLTVRPGLDPELTVSSSERDFSPPSPMEDSGHNTPLKITLKDCGEEVDPTENDSDKLCIISDLCCSLPSTNLQSLHVARTSEISADFWRDLLGHLDQLRCMRLSSGCMPDLSHFLLAAREPQSTCDEDPIPSHLFIPALEELELHRIIFICDDVQQEGVVSRKSLFDALSTRKGVRDQLKMSMCRAKTAGRKLQPVSGLI